MAPHTTGAVVGPLSTTSLPVVLLSVVPLLLPDDPLGIVLSAAASMTPLLLPLPEPLLDVPLPELLLLLLLPLLLLLFAPELLLPVPLPEPLLLAVPLLPELLLELAESGGPALLSDPHAATTAMPVETKKKYLALRMRPTSCKEA